MPQGFDIDSPKYAYKLAWYERLRNYFSAHLSPQTPAIWCGDMNVAPRPMDVHSPEKHLTHVCYHEAARRAYEQTVAWGFQDVFVKLYPSRRDGGGGRRAAASERAFGPYLFVGRIFDLTVHATPTLDQQSFATRHDLHLTPPLFPACEDCDSARSMGQ